MTFPTIPTVANGRVLPWEQPLVTGNRNSADLSGLTKNAGDLLIVIFAAYQSSATANAVWSGWSAGWTEFMDRSSATGMAIGAAYKWSDGTETGVVAVTEAATVTGHAVSLALSIPGAHATTPPEASTTLNQGTTSAVPVPALNPAGWDVEDTLWIAVGANGETATTGSFTGVTAAPAGGYTDFAATAISGDVVGGLNLAVAFFQNAVSNLPSGFNFTVDISNARNAAGLIAVRPAPAGATTHQMAVTVAGTSGVAAALTTTQQAAVTIPATSGMAADLTVVPGGPVTHQMAVTIPATSGVSASLTLTALLAATVAAVSGVTATLRGLFAMAATTAASAASSAALTLRATLGVTIPATTGQSADLIATHPMAATVAATSGLTADLTVIPGGGGPVTHSMAVTIPGTTGAAYALTLRATLSVTPVAVTSAVSATMQALFTVGVTVPATSGLSATMRLVASMSVSVAAAAGSAADLRRVAAFAATWAAQSGAAFAFADSGGTVTHHPADTVTVARTPGALVVPRTYATVIAPPRTGALVVPRAPATLTVDA